MICYKSDFEITISNLLSFSPFLWGFTLLLVSMSEVVKWRVQQMTKSVTAVWTHSLCQALCTSEWLTQSTPPHTTTNSALLEKMQCLHGAPRIYLILHNALQSKVCTGTIFGKRSLPCLCYGDKDILFILDRVTWPLHNLIFCLCWNDIPILAHNIKIQCPVT